MNKVKHYIDIIYRNSPSWARKMYGTMPLWVKRLSVTSHGAASKEPRPVWKQTLFPLDSAWSEVIFAPFHDPKISRSLPFAFNPISAKGCVTDFFWCYTTLAWHFCPSGKEAAEFVFDADINLPQYDNLILCLAVPKAVKMNIEARIDNAWRHIGEGIRGTGQRMEALLPIPNGHISAIKIVFIAEDESPQSLGVIWFGLQNSGLVKQMSESKIHYSPEWPGLILPAEDWGPVKFQRGLLFNETEIERLRKKKDLPVWKEHFRFLEEKAEEYLKRIPEQDIGDYLPTSDRRYIRERETGKTLYAFEALVLGFVGLVNEDRRMMLHAMRYLMSMVHTATWAQSAESRLRGSTWDQRCFNEEAAVYSTSLLTDWYSFALSGRAKDLIMSSLWDKGLSVIERDMMKHPYLYRMNQGVWFCRSRILGGLILESHWKQVGNYVDRAYRDMHDILSRYIMKDGGVDEGVGYFCMASHAAIPGLLAYARHRNINPKKILSEHFLKTENYVRAMSGSVPGTAEVDGDCRTDYFCGDIVPVMAGFFPGSAYGKILKACLAKETVYHVTGGLSESGGIVGFVYGPDRIIESECILPVFSVLPDSGYLSSFRKDDDGRSTHIFIHGSKPCASHSHLDKGAIVLDIDGKAVLIDRGMTNYAHTESMLLRKSCMHNVITPLLEDGAYPDQNPPYAPIVPSGAGDNISFKARIDLAPVWRNYMLTYRRTVESKNLSEILIIDEGELRNSGRLAIHLHALRPFVVSDKTATLVIDGITMEIHADWADEIIHNKDLVDFKYNDVYHFAIHSREFKKFKLITRISRKQLCSRTILCHAHKSLMKKIKSASPLNVIVGSGWMKTDGWISTDIKMLDISRPDDWRRLFKPESIDRLLSEHVLEHLTEEECRVAFSEAYKYLKSGGLFRIAVPDGYRKDAAYVAEVTPPKDGHKQLFTVDTLVPLLEDAGFQVNPLEYFDADEKFHYTAWNPGDGLIKRSLRFDRQQAFKRDDMFYTSLIVDAIKPAPVLETVALIDPFWSGHHEMYLKLFSKAFLERQCRVMVFCSEPDKVRSWVEANCPSVVDRFHSFPFRLPKPGRFPFKKVRDILTPVTMWRDASRAVKTASVETGKTPDMVFFMWLDHYYVSNLSVLSGMLFKHDWTGILFHPDRFPPMFFGLLSTISSAFKTMHLPFRLNNLKAMVILNELAEEYLKKELKSIPVIVFPDITDDTPPEKNYPLIDDIIRKAGGRKIIGVVGSLAKYKGVATLIKVARRAEGKDWFFVFAGKLVEKSFSAEELALVKDFMDAVPENCFLYNDYIPDEPKFNAVVSVCDVLFAAYENFKNSSNILAKASIFRKPVIVSDGYCMAERARKYKMGFVVRQGNVDDCILALENLLDNGAFDVSQAGFEEYRQNHSIDNLNRLIGRLCEAVGRPCR